MRSLPEQLLNSLKSLAHFNTDDFIEAHREENKITSIRLNPFKTVALDFMPGSPVKWSQHGFYLNERPSFTLDPLFHAGAYYVQEAGSMFLEHALWQVLDLGQNLKILDACAAPGGKSTLINSLLTEESLLVSNEIIRSRSDILAQQLSKWGTCNSVVTNSDPSRFGTLQNYFDVVVVDAPCSGSGLFRKQPEAIDEWSPANVRACSVRQEKILAEVLPCLKENGILFYSTCSYSVEENEAIVQNLISQHQMEFVEIETGTDWGIVESGAGYRFYPHLTMSEGFFCAILRKTGTETAKQYTRRKKPAEISKKEASFLQDFLKYENKTIVKKNEQYHLMNPEAASFLDDHGKDLYFKKAGTVIGEIKGQDLVPNHEFALSLMLGDRQPAADLDREAAIKYLRKEAFQAGENRKGFALMRYKNLGIGWAKILPNRINNYLPNEFRIIK